MDMLRKKEKKPEEARRSSTCGRTDGSANTVATSESEAFSHKQSRICQEKMKTRSRKYKRISSKTCSNSLCSSFNNREKFE
ncbi:hypothetical protein PoB_005790700 [Plakobranchus ocellatus]|uniref:Uncharacterized protein n=1 Tax=Plakobranchus ocellatus TaxID=259542 RepID=A0AAV4CIU9_9GAST|nr:hypothetical protein PoB_005790700 [Plakobranchus ocellatus]